MKYIILRYDAGLEVPVIFSEVITHDALLFGKHKMFGQPSAVSAGFWNGVVADGSSVSLKLTSRPKDTALIQKHLEEM